MIKKEKDMEIGPYFNLLLKLGLTMTVSIISFFFLGLFLEKLMPSGGLILIIFVLLGIGIGMIFLYKEVMKLENDHDPK